MKPRAIAVDDFDLFFPSPMNGVAHAVSGETEQPAPVLLVPDEVRGGYREHEAKVARPAVGFRR